MKEQEQNNDHRSIADNDLFNKKPTYKVTEHSDGLVVRLDGYLIEYIRITKNLRHRRFNVEMQDTNGNYIKIHKTADNEHMTVTMCQPREIRCT